MSETAYAGSSAGENRVLLAIGLMSGTSLDGVDAALIRTDGVSTVESLGAVTVPYDEDLRSNIRDAIRRAEWLPNIDPLTSALTRVHANAVATLLASVGVPLNSVHVIGFHGQTILHRPESGMTWQIGDGAMLADLTGVDVVSDFRSADVESGGEGAPLAPIFHAAIAAKLEKPVAILNIGGVANVTWIDADGAMSLLAFDTGPGNAMIDDWMLTHMGTPMDDGGALAARGRVHDDILAELLQNDYFDRSPPKSLDRNDFSAKPVAGLSPSDGAATLSAFTAAAVARALDHFPTAPVRWLVCGGGRRNATLMSMLATRVQAPIEPIEAIGWDGDSLEAQAFGYLAVRHLRGLPISFPTTTGVSAPMSGGSLDEG
jgi:anhydro-N-acetylmuramic acid kinase